jgi:initiation factor 1A
MGRNTTGGNKQKRGKNSTQDSKKRPLTYADNKDTLYALVISPLGDCGFLVHCNDNVERIGIIRGAMYKSSFIQSGDMTLVSLREFEQVKLGRKERCDVLLKYHAEEVSQLVKRGLYYKDSVRPFLTKLEKGKSTKFDHHSEAGGAGGGGGGGGGGDDDIITMVADAPPKIKKAQTSSAQSAQQKESEESEEDDSEFLLAKEDLNDFYGSQEEGDDKKKVKVKEHEQTKKDDTDDTHDTDNTDEEEAEAEAEKLDCFGNRIS